jgi:hypothetical protein
MGRGHPRAAAAQDRGPHTASERGQARQRGAPKRQRQRSGGWMVQMNAAARAGRKVPGRGAARRRARGPPRTAAAGLGAQAVLLYQCAYTLCRGGCSCRMQGLEASRHAARHPLTRRVVPGCPACLGDVTPRRIAQAAGAASAPGGPRPQAAAAAAAAAAPGQALAGGARPARRGPAPLKDPRRARHYKQLVRAVPSCQARPKPTTHTLSTPLFPLPGGESRPAWPLPPLPHGRRGPNCSGWVLGGGRGARGPRAGRGLGARPRLARALCAGGPALLSVSGSASILTRRRGRCGLPFAPGGRAGPDPTRAATAGRGPAQGPWTTRREGG